MQDVGFDYGLTPREAGDALIAGAQVLWERELIFDVHTNSSKDPLDSAEAGNNVDG